MNAIVLAIAAFLVGGMLLFAVVRRHHRAEFRRIALRSGESRALSELLLTQRLTGMIW